MSGDDTPLTDDYVASLLASRAKTDQREYSRTGIGAFRSTKCRPKNALKPNARFLRNLIRDTDSHNDALLVKETERSHARLQGLKRAREVENSSEGRVSKRKPGRQRPTRWAHALSGLGSKSHQQTGRGDRDEGRESDKGQRGEPLGGLSTATHPRPSYEDFGSKHDQKRRLPVTEPISKVKRPSLDDLTRLGQQSSYRGSQIPQANKVQEADPDLTVDEIGPAKPDSQPRGRGSRNSAFGGIDARFSADYNPKTDVSLDDDADVPLIERDAWEIALEAIQNRKQYKSCQEQRLRVAGFSEKEIERWRKSHEVEGGNTTRVLEWTTEDRAREWDRGKVNLV